MRTILFAAAMALAPIQAGAVSIGGSTTVAYALVIPERERIESQAQETLRIVPNGSNRGLVDLVEGRTDIAMLSAALEVETLAINSKQPGKIDPGALRVFPIARSRAAFLVHPDNPLHALTIDQLAAIWTLQVTNWRELGGADLPIMLVAVVPGGGVRTTVEQLVLHGNPLPQTTRTVPNGPQVSQVVAQVPGAIGISSTAAATKDVRIIDVDRPIEQSLSLVTLGEPSPAITRVLNAIRLVAADKFP